MAHDITERKRAAEVLNQAQPRIESVLESVTDVHILFDEHWRYLYVNEAAVRAIGRPREEIIGRTLWQLYPDTVGTEFERQVLRSMEERVAVVFDFHYSANDTWWQNRFHPAPEGLIVFANDITERKRTEQRLLQSEDRFRQLAENITEVFWMVTRDKQPTLYVSPAYEKIWGRSCESLYQSPGNWADAIHPDDRRRIELAVESKRLLGDYDEEYRIIRPDGSIRWIRDRAFPIKGATSDIYRVVGIAEDITERKRAEEARRQAEAKYHSIFEHAIEGIFQTTPEGRYLTANAALARILGYESPEELINARTDIKRQQYVEPERRSEFKRQLEEHNFVKGFEYQAYRKNGSKIWLSDNVRAVRDESGTLLYYEGFTEDITERKRAQERLKASTEQLRTLSARLQNAREEEATRIAREIHDELGGALTSLRWDLDSFCKIISESRGSPDLGAIQERVESMMQLIDSTITAVRRISAELRPNVLHNLGLIEAIEWQAQQFQAKTGIICRCAHSPEEIELSPQKATAVFRIFQEALTNVLRHAQATSVNIRIEENAGDVVLEIKDDGRGITSNDKAGQLSLGLLGMRERAHLIGAKFDIKRENGQGTSVSIRVPTIDQS